METNKAVSFPNNINDPDYGVTTYPIGSEEKFPSITVDDSSINNKTSTLEMSMS